MGIFEMVSIVLAIPTVAFAVVQVIRIGKGAIFGRDIPLTIKYLEGRWGVYMGDSDRLAKQLRVKVGDTLTWTIINHEDQEFTAELSFPTIVFKGLTNKEEGVHMPIFARKNQAEVEPITLKVSPWAPPGRYPYAVEAKKDEGPFARGGSHTEVHVDWM